MSKEKEQTGVEWLFSYMFNPSLPQEEQFKLLEKAKEMEKEQIIKAHITSGARLEDISIEAAEDYYNETYEGGKK
jgi:hypothetical protein